MPFQETKRQQINKYTIKVNWDESRNQHSKALSAYLCFIYKKSRQDRCLMHKRLARLKGAVLFHSQNAASVWKQSLRCLQVKSRATLTLSVFRKA